MAGIEVKYEILNQRQTPAFYASSLATRPAFGFAGRMFIDSDSPSTGIYRDTGSAWVHVADQGVGTTGTLQAVTTNGNTSNTGISVTANGIGIGTTIPASNRLDIHSASGLQGTFNGTGVTNAGLQLQSAGVGKWDVRNNYNAGANDFGVFDVLNNIDRVKITNAGVISLTGITNISSRLNLNGATDNSIFALNTIGNSYLTGSSGIGTTNISRGKLTVSNSGPSIIYNSETSVGVNSFWNSSDGSVVKFGSESNHPVYITTNNINRFIFKETGVINIISISTYATNALALAGGLVTGDIYKNAAGVLSIVL